MITFTTFALIVAQPNITSLPWYAIVLLIVSIIATVVFLIIAVIYFRRYLLYLTREYQKPPSVPKGLPGSVIMNFPGFIGIGTGTKFDSTTQNTKNHQFEFDKPIQAVRFIKPIEKVIRPKDIPAVVQCEHRILWRLRNKLLGIAEPRIIVKQFTEMGIIWDEENTYGVDFSLELTPTPPQVKTELQD